MSRIVITTYAARFVTPGEPGYEDEATAAWVLEEDGEWITDLAFPTDQTALVGEAALARAVSYALGVAEDAVEGRPTGGNISGQVNPHNTDTTSMEWEVKVTTA